MHTQTTDSNSGIRNKIEIPAPVSTSRNKFLLMKRIGASKHSESQVSTYIAQYAQCDSIAEARAILDEAYAGNPAAQYIIAMALAASDQHESDEWMRRSADQGFKPAIIKLRKRSSKEARSTDKRRLPDVGEIA
jgi:TPR repeat protein